MLNVSYEVKVWVGGTDDIPTIGLSGGVCTWSREIGILSDEWWGTLSSMIDMSSSGNYETYSPTSVNIVKSKIVEKTLNNYGLTLTGKRIEIHEITTTTRVLYRGVVDKMASSGENSVKISISHLVNKYNANLTNKVGKDYTYLVYGHDVDGVPLIVDKDAVSVSVGAIGAEEYYPAFRNITTDSDESSLVLQSVYDTTTVSYDDLVTFFAGSKDYIIQGTGSYVATLSFIDERNDGHVIFMTVRPCKYKDSTGYEGIPYNEVAVVKYAFPSVLNSPYNSTIDETEVYLENGNRLPFYIDSLQYKDESIEILDADDTGFLFIKPQRTRFANDYEMKELFGNDIVTTGADGVCIYSDVNTEVLSSTATSSYGDNLAYRGTGNTPEAFCSFDGGNIGVDYGYMSTHFVGAYDVKDPEGFETINASMSSNLTNVDWDLGITSIARNLTSIVAVKTVGGIKTISSSNHDGAVTPSVSEYLVDNYLLPQSPDGFRSENRWFRYSNSSITQRLWYSVDVLSDLEEYEKKNPITVYYIVTVGGEIRNSAFLKTATLESMKMNVFSQESYSLSEMYADNVNGKDGVVTIADMYTDACSRQNLSSIGFQVPSVGWGLDIPSGDITQAVNTSDIALNAPADVIKYKTESTGTKAVKNDLLRYGFGLGFIDSEGLESWANLLDMYDDGGINITAYDVIGKPSVVGFNSNRVYCDIGITTHEGNFTVSNTEQDTGSYDSSFTSGFEAGTGKGLWLLGNILYKKYNVKNEYPKALGDVDAIIDEEKYIRNQYAIAGAVTVGDATVLYDRYTLKISLPTEFVIANSLWKGKNIVFTFPHIASLHTGIITGMGKDISKEVYTITAEMVGDVLDSTETYTIIESGSQPDNIIESGTQTNNYVEAV